MCCSVCRNLCRNLCCSVCCSALAPNAEECIVLQRVFRYVAVSVAVCCSVFRREVPV